MFTSPLQRARQTCALAGMGERAIVDDDLVEWDYGEFEGTRTADLRETDPGVVDLDGDDQQRASRSTTSHGAPIACSARLDAVDGTVMLFAHAHFLRILAARWCGFPAIGGSRLTLLPASISVLGFEREVQVIEQWNLNTDSPPGVADHGYAGMANER